jgi:hypothetical protein
MKEVQTMAEYIEREKLIDELEHLHEDAELSYLGVYDCVKTVPTADVVPVEWISVKNRLPEKEGQYLCASYYKTTDSWHTNLYWFSKDLYKFNDLDFSDKKGVSGFWDSDSEWGCCHHENVTHWMPLPEPPKKEGASDV